MGKVKPRHVHSGSDHLLEYLRRFRSRAYGAYDLGLVGWEFHAVFSFRMSKPSEVGVRIQILLDLDIHLRRIAE
jgi:hypothetical protein